VPQAAHGFLRPIRGAGLARTAGGAAILAGSIATFSSPTSAHT
jgi:hypothetical protein